jgi:hypothetical protein
MTRIELTPSEIGELRLLVERRNAAAAQIDALRTRIAVLEGDLKAQGREQDAWMLCFVARHNLTLSVLSRLQIDPNNGVVLLP